MNDLNVIDRFLSDFVRYIDSGFGLLGGDVAFLTATLIGIDVTLAGLFWALGGEDNVIGRFLKKILYIGAFAFILNNFPTLTDIVFRSLAQAGLTAGGGTLGTDDLLKPGRLAGTGFEAAWPLLEQASRLLGFTNFFDNFLTIAILLFAWVLVVVAFFVLAVQLFVTILEFKLTSLAGFILVPFALWNRTSFLAERVLGNVISSGIKVMVLAVIVAIGANFFAEFTSAQNGAEPDIGAAMSLVLASLSLFGLGIFGPSIASGLVSGGPQLGAGAAIGTALGAAGIAMLGGGAAVAGARALGGAGLGAVRAGTALGAGARTAFALGQESAGSSSVGAGLGGVARAGLGAIGQQSRDALGLGQAAASGRRAAWAALNDAKPGESGGSDASRAPGWARDLRAEQSMRHRRQVAIAALREGDRGGAGAVPDIKEKDE